MRFLQLAQLTCAPSEAQLLLMSFCQFFLAYRTGGLGLQLDDGAGLEIVKIFLRVVLQLLFVCLLR